MNRNDDIVKALGFVALYAAYVEESIDMLMERLSIVKQITEKEKRWPTSRKLEWCKGILNSFESEEFKKLIHLLGETKKTLGERNEIIHGRIYPGNDRSDILKSGRSWIPDREVTADELYDIAETLLHLQAAIPNINYFATIKSINEKELA